MWRQVFELFDHALELAPDERDAYLERACAGDRPLREDVEALLANAGASSFLDGPAVEFVSPLLSDLASDFTSGGSASQIGPYRIVRELGHGGMGTVYLAERADHQYQKRVALKLLPAWSAANDRMVRRFVEERQIMAALDHPDIASLFDGGVTAEGLPWFAMEYVEGAPIDSYRQWGEFRMTAPDPWFQMLRLTGYDPSKERGIYRLQLRPIRRVHDFESRWRTELGVRYVF